MPCCRISWLVLGATAVTLGCGGRAESPPALPASLVLRIDAVEVGTKRDQGSWDGSEAQEVAGAAEKPDLAVRVGVGADVAYTSWVEPDTVSQSLQYEFLVPVAAVPPDGLRVEVLDDDRDKQPELIGSMRLSRQELTAAYRTASKLLVLSDGAVRRLEIVVSGYTPVETINLSRRASDGPAPVGPGARAGEVVSVRASGRFRVGSWFDDTLDPAGYPGGDARSYNLRSFEKEPHACAIALIAKGRNIEGEVIGLGRTFVAAHAGALSVGLNDKDLSNNEGQVTFQIARRAPTVDEWLRGGRSE